jgi:glutamate N-acetyltransferase / amino-acid N-acetyltransferase
VLAATGSVPLSAPLDPTRVNVSFVPTDGSPVLPLLVNGEPEQVDEVRAKEILSAEDLEVRVDLHLGSESAKYWTCDFSYVSSLCFERGDVRIELTDGYDIYRST